MKLSRDEVRSLLQHYKLASQHWAKLFEKEMRGLNSDGRVYPKYAAPVVVIDKGAQKLEQMKWGMPGPMFPGKAKPGCLTLGGDHVTAQQEASPFITPAPSLGGGRGHGS
jgi:hypothetical protein